MQRSLTSNIEQFKNDLQHLVEKGEALHNAILNECHPDTFKNQLERQTKDKKKVAAYIKTLPDFRSKYQSWYSEALAVIRLMLPDRLNDFIKLYDKPKARKSIEYGNYVIEDYLQDLVVTTSWGERKVGPEAAISQFTQQLNILKSVERKFESSLFDIKQLTQADLFDSELDAARELNKKGFMRGAGAITGVVLEKHLKQICDNHKITVSKKHPTIANLNDLLKNQDVIDVPQWRKVQHLADIRNLCDHNKDKEPTIELIDEMINEVGKIIKTMF